MARNIRRDLRRAVTTCLRSDRRPGDPRRRRDGLRLFSSAGAVSPSCESPMSDPKSRSGPTNAELLARIRQIIGEVGSETPPAWRTKSGIPRATPDQAEPLFDGSRTIEEIVQHLLRPRLQRWVDENLPRLVEPTVRESVARALPLAK
jgi:cell pole-organizing protein PopZ